MPIVPKRLSFSPKIKVPIKIVVSKLKTVQIAPVVTSDFFCKMAGSQANVPSE